MSIYKSYNPHQVEELLSNFLVNHWSYSSVASFARHEKEFEMRYLYNEKGRLSATAVAGQAYHKALELYFNNLKSGIVTDIVDMQQSAFDYISEQRADIWKISKTRPTVQECINDAVDLSNKAIMNFLAEAELITSQIKEIIAIELRIKAWVTINGVDIPLPVSMYIDFVGITNEGKRVIIDWKLKIAFSDEKEMQFTIGKQAITYVKGYESKFNQHIDEVWFIENKTSKNRDGSPQLSLHKSVMDKSTRRLYEVILYEPLKRMVEAVNDADYVYLINDNDNFSDKAEIYEFWSKTLIAEVDDFDIPNDKKPLIEKRLKKIRDASLAMVSPKVIKNFKKFTEQFIPYDLSNKDMTKEQKIEHVLRSFGILTEVRHTFDGYSSSSYLLDINAGTSISNINKHRLDIANALNVPNVRIRKDLTVYDGKSYLTIESGKKSTETLAWDKSRLKGSKIPIGVDNFQQTVVWDMENPSTPHILICGATGSGKSVCIKSTIEYALSAGVKKVYIFDPKYEFLKYAEQKGITVVNDIEDIERTMKELVDEMEQRVKKQKSQKTLIIFDEYADAVANSRKGKDLKIYETIIVGQYQNGNDKTKRECIGEERSLEENLRILLQKGRSSGFRIIAATQRASVKVITGDAKVNFPVQVCFQVPKDVDSVVVIDEPGAESLNGRGDGLIKSPEYMGVVRFQAFYKD